MRELGPYLGLGMQLALAMVLFGGLGYWLDMRFATKPVLFIIGLMLGAAGGMISLIRTALRSTSKSDKDAKPK